jgi:hypothetical protein
MEEINSNDGTNYKIESILPEKDSKDQEIFRVNIEAIATNSIFHISFARSFSVKSNFIIIIIMKLDYYY